MFLDWLSAECLAGCAFSRAITILIHDVRLVMRNGWNMDGKMNLARSLLAHKRFRKEFLFPPPNGLGYYLMEFGKRFDDVG